MKNKLLVAALIVVGVASVAYAAFAQTLVINGKGTTSGDWNVKITSITAGAKVGATDVTAPTYTDTSATFDVELAYPGASATYDVVVSNSGSVPAKLDTITDLATLNSTAPAYIKYTVTGVTAGTTTLAASATNTVTVKVEWDANDTTGVTGQSKSATITLDYSQDI